MSQDDETLKSLVRSARLSEASTTSAGDSRITRITGTLRKGVTNLFEFAIRSPLNPSEALSKRSRIKATIFAAVLACIFTLSLTESGAADGVEAQLYDLKAREFAQPVGEASEIVVITIDEASLKDIQRQHGWAFPWPRFLYNKVLRYCEEAGARAVVFDQIFADAGRNTNDPSAQGEVSSDYLAARYPSDLLRLDQAYGGRLIGEESIRSVRFPQKHGAWDDLFAAQLSSSSPVVLAASLSREEVAGSEDLLPLIALDGVDAEGLHGSSYRGIVLPFHQALTGNLEAFPAPMNLNASNPDQRARIAARVSADLQAMTWAASNDPAFRSSLPESWQPRGDQERSMVVVGMVDNFADSHDGAFRRYQLALRHGQSVLPSLALAAYAALHDADSSAEVERTAQGDWRIGDLSIPTQPDGSMLIKWRARRAMQNVFGIESVAESDRAKLYPDGDVPYSFKRIPISLIMQDWDRIWHARHGVDPARGESARTRMEQAKAFAGDVPSAADERNAAASAQQSDASNSLDVSELLLGDPAKLLGGKVVFIAGTAEGLRDVRPTPISPSTNGVELHATALDMLMKRDFITHAPRAIEPIQVALSTLLVAAAVMFLASYWWSICTTLVLAGLSTAASVILYAQGDVQLEMAGGLLAPCMSFSVSAVLKVFTLDAHTRHIRRFSERYMSSKLVDYVLKNPNSMRLGGEKRQLSIFFSDIEGFTSISEALAPEQLTTLINEYLRAMSRVIMDECDGVVDKFIGDAIMAYWGAPVASEDHAERACRAALACQRELYALQPRLKEIAPQLVRTDRDGVQVAEIMRARVGINTGLVTAGNMGSEKRMNYTVMGDAVNQASRYEGANKAYGSSIMIGETTHSLVAEKFVTRPLDRLVVKGKTRPASVHELIAEGALKDQPEELQRLLEHYHQAYQAYLARDFEAALKGFEASAKLETHQAANPSKVYAERCRHFIANPPSVSWDGVFVMTSK